MRAVHKRAIALAATAAALWGAGADAAQIHNSSQSNRVSRISGGSVEVLSFGGTGVSLGVLDEDEVATLGVGSHQVTPSGAFGLASRPSLPTELGGPLPDLFGIDTMSNQTGQVGSFGITTTLSEQVGTVEPLQQMRVHSTTVSSADAIGTETILLAGINDNVDEKTNTSEAARCKRSAGNDAAMAAANEALCAKKRRWGKGWFGATATFDADEDAQLELTESIDLDLSIDISSDPDIRGAISGVSVLWAFGIGEIVGESTLFSDSATFEITADASQPVESLLLTDVLLYDLTYDLVAGETYWFSVDTLSYSVMVVPEPSTLTLLLIPAAAALLVRRARS